MTLPDEGRRRAVIEGVTPEIDAGRFPIKRVLGEQVVVEADAFADGHDALIVVLRYCKEGQPWSETAMVPLGNDRWRAAFPITEIGRYRYTVAAWVDRFRTWARDLSKRVEAGQDVTVEMLIGAELVEQAARRAGDDDSGALRDVAVTLRGGDEESIALALSPQLAALMERNADRRFATIYPDLKVWAEPVRARYGAWYELFPRSYAQEAGQHGTFKDVIRHLPYVASMGFDVLYLPPIHPVGRSFRKGKNNNVNAATGEPGSPWAIGAAEGGHKDILPELGTLDDFTSLIAAAKKYNIEIAMDIAFQAAPDHPYVEQHRSWFRARPDGTIQYAENPPKKYQDIYPFDFESEDWHGMWLELKSVFEYWIAQGITIFRVDNPHTKAFSFWEWCMDELKREHPQTIYLAEAFTRPKVLYQFAKLGYTQSYNYFPWRNTKAEITQFMTELTQTQLREYLRPSLWSNTPDILTEYLQIGGRPAFMIRAALMSTLGATYGVYGAAFELSDNTPVAPGKEEYFNSEKYEIKRWDLERPDSLKPYLTRLNQIRRENPALHTNDRLQFHPTSSDQIIAYSKTTPDYDNIVLVVVNLDPHAPQSGLLELPLHEWGIAEGQVFHVHDLLNNEHYMWNGRTNYVELHPHSKPAHVFLVQRRVRDERDFDYYANV